MYSPWLQGPHVQSSRPLVPRHVARTTRPRRPGMPTGAARLLTSSSHCPPAPCRATPKTQNALPSVPPPRPRNRRCSSATVCPCTAHVWPRARFGRPDRRLLSVLLRQATRTRAMRALASSPLAAPRAQPRQQSAAFAPPTARDRGRSSPRWGLWDASSGGPWFWEEEAKRRLPHTHTERAPTSTSTGTRRPGRALSSPVTNRGSRASPTRGGGSSPRGRGSPLVAAILRSAQRPEAQ